ncbi:NlpC/P60 family protein [Phytomonospora sp. NPDC050363]|uniref:C40 family peptidase n=1 Tax=Phytomonospora sp. NPDC050363 TaxID=3155642 RepID=UPI003400E47D
MLGKTARNASRGLRAFGIIALATGALVLSAAPAYADPTDKIEDEIDKQFHDLEAVIEDYNKVSIEFKETKKKVAKLEKELKPFEEQLEVLYQKVDVIASNAYMGGPVSGMTAVFTTGSPDTLADRITLLDQATADDADAIAELNTAKSDLDERKAVLDGLYETQSEQEAELKEKKESIKADLDRLSDERDTAYRDSRGLSDDAFVPPHVPGERGKVVEFALAQQGDAYDMNASGPDVWDCSGLTMGAWQQAGVNLPHNAAAQWAMMQHVSRDELMPGDLVFYNGLNHVAMYIGDDHVVHASTYGVGVIVSTVDQGGSPYYGAGRPAGW